jgi:hypothetical protein
MAQYGIVIVRKLKNSRYEFVVGAVVVERKPYTSRGVRTVWEGSRIKPPMKVGMEFLSLFH